MLKDALKALNSELEAMFRRVAHESADREALERAVDDAEAALARVHKHNKKDVGLEVIAQNRMEALQLARSRLDAFNSDSWATRLKNLERAKTRMRTTAVVPDSGRRWRGPMMQRVLQNGTPATPEQLRHGLSLATVRYLRRVSDLCTAVQQGGDAAIDAGRETDTSEALALHSRWCKAALLGRPSSTVAASTSLLTDLWLRPAAALDFKNSFEALCAAADTLPEVVYEQAPLTLSSSGIPPEFLLPPAKHIATMRATFSDLSEVKKVLELETELLAKRVEAHVQQACLGGRAQAPSLGALIEEHTHYRLMRRDAVAQPAGTTE